MGRLRQWYVWVTQTSKRNKPPCVFSCPANYFPYFSFLCSLFLSSKKLRKMPLLITQVWGFGNKCEPFEPIAVGASQTYSEWQKDNTHGTGKGTKTKRKLPRNFWKCVVTLSGINPGPTRLCHYYRQVYRTCVSQLCSSLCVWVCCSPVSL